MRRGLRLHLDDPDDPRVFRAVLPGFGMSQRVLFSQASEDGVTPPRLLIDLFSFQKRPDVRNPRRWVRGAAAAGAVALAIATAGTTPRKGRRRRRRRRRAGHVPDQPAEVLAGEAGDEGQRQGTNGPGRAPSPRT